MRISVLLPLPINKLFDYQVDSDSLSKKLEIGQFVLVPFQSRELIGVIWEIKEIEHDNEIQPNNPLKSIIKVYDTPRLPHNMRLFLQWVAEYNMIAPGSVLKMTMYNQALTTKQRQQEHSSRQNAIEDIKINLSDAQKLAADKIIKNISNFNVTLLDGVTGSGKTAVYSDVTKHFLNQHAQILILLPEIVLTTHLLTRLQKTFSGHKLLQWHSGVTPKNKKIAWQSAINGECSITIGARSALFLPFSNLKLIIIDEEHDSSFKQEDSSIYNARDMAIVRAKIEKIPILLASATPSIETFLNAKIQKYNYVNLPERFSKIAMPEVHIIDMNNEILPRGHWISNTLKNHISNTLDSKKQSIIFLNRRGYAPISICKACKTKAQCKNCHFWLVLHKKKNILQCHDCGYIRPYTNLCTNCNSDEQMLAYGTGIERVTEEIQTLFPHARVAILTSDTISNQKTASKIIDDIHNNEVDIIIGTQVIAKGLHFKDLHLVGIIDADANNSGCDPRTLEKNYQLLHQVSGRAGREQLKGLVCIQTYNPNSIVLQNLASYNRERFLESEIMDRKAANMPPFSRLALITFSCKDEQLLNMFIRTIKISDDAMLGPAPAPIFFLLSHYRYRVIIKVNKEEAEKSVQELTAELLNAIKIPKYIKIKVDIDPYSFM